MMLIINLIIGLVFLILFSYLEVFSKRKDGKIPSVFTTTFVILALLVGGQGAIYAGLLGLCLAVLLKDIGLISTMSDLKSFVACSILLYYWPVVLLFAVMTAGLKYMLPRFSYVFESKMSYIHILAAVFIIEMFAMLV